MTPLAAPARRQPDCRHLDRLYLAFSVPVVIAGVATTHVGLHQTAVVYSAALAVLAAAAAGSFLLHRPPRRKQRSAWLRRKNRADNG